MIYLDNAATTPMLPEVWNAMLPWMQPDHAGNPSSIHTQGINARKAVEKARQQVAQLIGADPSEVYFTSGGTESNNTWLRCLDDYVVLTTALEHQSVLEALENGMVDHKPIITENINVHPDGSVELKDLERLIKLNAECLGAVTVMWVNNELGTVNPIKEAGAICKKYHVPFHSDAVQAAGHVPINVHDCNVDFLSLSGHKFGAPTGIGVLYISSHIHKNPLIYGGGQEHDMRGGTENVPGIVGIGKAAEIASERLQDWRQHWSHLRNVFLNELGKHMDGAFKINGDAENTSSSIISLTVPGINSESMLLLLDRREIYISAGSACSASSAAPSHVLGGIGMSAIDAASTVRISMGVETTAEEMAHTAKAIAEVSEILRNMYPQNRGGN